MTSGSCIMVLTATEIFTKLSQNVACTGIIFMCLGYSFSILTGSRFVYIVDSHARNGLGEPCPHGKAVILRFENLLLLATYIKYTYLLNDIMVQYDIQYVRVTCSITEQIRKAVLKAHKSENQSLHCAV